MAVGSVQPFTPTGATLAITTSAASVASAFTPTDSVLVTNGGTATAFLSFGQNITSITAASSSGGVPVLPSATQLFGTGQLTGAVAATYSGSNSGTVYITPGAGTQH